MQTAIADFIKDTPQGREADAILRSCVHCGFCTATCPTYQLLGDELDGPRGRIYLIKQALEGQPVTERTRLHLDRCLTCRSCETTCPSGVRYARLLDIGRELVEERAPRRWTDRVKRRAMRAVIPYRKRFGTLPRLARAIRPLLPAALRRKVPAAVSAGARPGRTHARTMLVLQGCVQPALAPRINAAAARVLDRLSVTLTEAAQAGCCGAMSYHTSAPQEGLNFARRNIDAWWPMVEAGAEAIVMTASGCGVFVKEYGHLLQDDPAYAAKARRISELTRDLVEVIEAEDLMPLTSGLDRGPRVAFQSPCTLQHGQKLTGRVEALLQDLGFTLTPVPNAHLCCGSAGTYSLLQPELSNRLRENKLAALTCGAPDLIATANIGCLAHLQGGSNHGLERPSPAGKVMPVVHWIQLLDPEGMGSPG